ncbi:hypothetical protein ABW20_dc0104632 [Dactylellina cionopaga]|nr:hypothetical protein ABW20_dc0104632 [Dactylellina cionopaga]
MFIFEPMYRRHSFPVPAEARLPPMIAAAVAMVAALFMFAWTAGLGISWIAPVISGSFFGYAALGLFVPQITYITDCFPKVAASASGANGLIRYTMGCIFPLVSRMMVDNLEVKWAMTLLGGIAALMLPLPFIFMRYGAKTRARGKFDRTAAAMSMA